MLSNTITCEAGVILQRAREAAASVDRLYPHCAAVEGSCTIGGNLSTNAGGTAALAYGIARALALGLEVVLADGRSLEQPQQAEEGQYRLRPEATCSSAPKARSASSPRRCCSCFKPAAEVGGDGAGRDPDVQSAVDLLGLATELTAGAGARRAFEIMIAQGPIDVRAAPPGTGVRDPLVDQVALTRC